MYEKYTKKTRITKLYSLDIKDENYDANVDTSMRQYNTIIKELGLVNESNEADLLITWLNDKNVSSLKTLTAKVRNKEIFEADLRDILQLQQSFYDMLEPAIFKDTLVTCRSSSDLDIVMNELKWRYSAHVPPSHTTTTWKDSLLHKVIEQSKNINNEIDSTLKLINEYYDNPVKLLRIKEFNATVTEALIRYDQIKSNLKPSNVTQNKNPFLALYHYMRNSYIRIYHPIRLPDMRYFDKCKTFDVSYEKKECYSLHDTALILTILISGGSFTSESSVKKSYDNLKKCFQKNEILKDYKVDGQFHFPNVAIPLSHYFYLRRKNKHDELDTDKFFGINRTVQYRIQPMLQVLLNGDRDVMYGILRYINFVNNEFEHIITSKNHSYQSNLLDFWFETITHIRAITMGLDRQKLRRFFPTYS